MGEGDDREEPWRSSGRSNKGNSTFSYIFGRFNPTDKRIFLSQRGEDQLDVFNVNIARQQAEMDIDRKGLKRVEDQPQGWLAWGKSWSVLSKTDVFSNFSV